MIKPNWDVFKAKFSDNPQFNFEWFCYLLFCKKFNKPYGIFRYKNQSAIETDPIQLNEYEIGFQAKFYDTTLSKHKKDVIDTLKKVKRDYPNIKKLYFYTNQEWVQKFSKINGVVQAKKTQSQKDVEDEADGLGIHVEWMCRSFFESIFVTTECQKICEYFFLAENSAVKTIEQQEKHTLNILEGISNEIIIGANKFSIERNDIFQKIRDNPCQVTIISGLGGVGKTAEIKRLHQELNHKYPFFIFKATEFELNRLIDFFKESNIYDFVDYFGDSERKIFVIDSAEKLLDLSNQEPAKEFIALALKKDWQIIFTTRDNYFEDLNFHCMEIYKITPLKIYISNLEPFELKKLAEKYSFKLPSDEKLLELIRTPLYLNEYITFLADSELFDYQGFKNKIWNSKIKKGSAKREQTLINLALLRANEGFFFLKPDMNQIDVAMDLAKDGLLCYENGLFFLAHDIYEEWALEKHINSEFISRKSQTDFFEAIGQSLPIRRSYRTWVSEKLYLKDGEINFFLEEGLDNDFINLFWKDEILVSILLSDYSDTFFQTFESDLLNDNLELLGRISFLLRIACKVVDDSLFSALETKFNADLSYNVIFTKPKGRGWSVFIKFIYEHLDQLNIKNMSVVLPVLYEWNSSFKQGKTTYHASMLALKYYEWQQANNYVSRGNLDKVLPTIANGAHEIKSLLSNILATVVDNQYTSHRDPYADLTMLILTKFEGLPIVSALPEKTFDVANVMWLKDYSASNEHDHLHESEFKFGITNDYGLKYSPNSAYQTPIFFLLQNKTQEAIDFVIYFVNKVTKNLVSYYGDDKVPSGRIIFDEFEKNVYLNASLWGAYRGAGNAPDLLKSILMAIEKYFLNFGDKFDEVNLELWLLYLLKKTDSSAIVGVVTSIVLKYPDKTFNVAKSLFQTKEFFDFDTQRWLFDQHHKSQLLSLQNMFGGLSHNEFFEKERLNACDEQHRRMSLEHLFLHYQFVRNEDVSEGKFHDRQKDLWVILDNYYNSLDRGDDSEATKLWRLCLARMDGRKMKIITEAVDQGISVTYDPHLPPELKDFSEKSLDKINKNYKYMPLRLWATNKLKQEDAYKKYVRYENTPFQALEDLKELLVILKNDSPTQNEFLELLDYATPSYVCATLIKYHQNDLSTENINFCVQLIIERSSFIFSQQYKFQMGDGIDACFFVMPEIMEYDSSTEEQIKLILLAGLFNSDRIGIWGNDDAFYTISINAINRLWGIHEENAKSLLIGYLVLKPLYSKFIKNIRKELLGNKQNIVNFDGLLHCFFDENKSTIEALTANNLSLDILDGVENLDLETKSVALQIIPNNPHPDYQAIFNDIVCSTVKYLLSDDRDNRPDSKSQHDFLKRFAHYVLASSKNDIPKLVQPFIDGFRFSDGAADMLNEFVLAQDKDASYDNFWTVWNLFKPIIIRLTETEYNKYHSSKVIRAYLFVQRWKDTTSNWHTFKPENKRFFGDISIKLAMSTSTLFSIAKLLTDIGSTYQKDGIKWIANILNSNSKLADVELEQDTVYYLNKFIRKYLYLNRQEVKQSKELKEHVLTILDLLIKKGEVSGYFLRESIV